MPPIFHNLHKNSSKMNVPLIQKNAIREFRREYFVGGYEIRSCFLWTENNGVQMFDVKAF